MSKEYKKRPIKCCNCGKLIAKGELPALVEVKCDKCGTINDLSQVGIDPDVTKPFADRLQLEKKVVPPFGFNCSSEVIDATGRKLEKKDQVY